jgi:hypothetical protein
MGMQMEKYSQFQKFLFALIIIIFSFHNEIYLPFHATLQAHCAEVEEMSGSLGRARRSRIAGKLVAFSAP